MRRSRNVVAFLIWAILFASSCNCDEGSEERYDEGVAEGRGEGVAEAGGEGVAEGGGEGVSEFAEPSAEHEQARWVPPELDDLLTPADQVARPVSICARLDGTILVTDESVEEPIEGAELAATVRPLLEERQSERVVFVDFEGGVPYAQVLGMMNTLKELQRGDDDLVEKVALRPRDDPDRACAAP